MLKVELIGNLGADAEVKVSDSYKFVSMRVAHSDRWTDESGEKHETTQWVDVNLSNIESKIIPYLKKGTTVFVRGRLATRVYSSPKDRCMKAGVTIHATEIELLGGSSDAVPRELIDPVTALIYPVSKHYWVERDNSKMKKDEIYLLVDKAGRKFNMNKGGFVVPEQPVEDEQPNTQE